MAPAAANKRDAFRMKPEEFETGAGIVVGRKVIPATLVDYSLGGCAIAINNKLDLSIGDEIRVATAKGQYLGHVRRVQRESNGMIIGVQFSTTVDKQFKASNSLHLFSRTGKHTGGAYFGIGTMVVALAAWAVVGYGAYLVFGN